MCVMPQRGEMILKLRIAFALAGLNREKSPFDTQPRTKFFYFLGLNSYFRMLQKDLLLARRNV